MKNTKLKTIVIFILWAIVLISFLLYGYFLAMTVNSDSDQQVQREVFGQIFRIILFILVSSAGLATYWLLPKKQNNNLPFRNRFYNLLDKNLIISAVTLIVGNYLLFVAFRNFFYSLDLGYYFEWGVFPSIGEILSRVVWFLITCLVFWPITMTVIFFVLPKDFSIIKKIVTKIKSKQ